MARFGQASTTSTRPATNIGPKNTPVSAGETNAYEIVVTGDQGDCTGTLAVSTDATAVATNVTAIAPVAPTSGRPYVAVYPGDAARPTTSNLNFLNGSPPVPNKVDVGLSATGTIKIVNFGRSVTPSPSSAASPTPSSATAPTHRGIFERRTDKSLR